MHGDERRRAGYECLPEDAAGMNGNAGGGPLRILVETNNLVADVQVEDKENLGRAPAQVVGQDITDE